MFAISHKGKVTAYVHSALGSWDYGWEFLGSQGDPLQVGLGVFSPGRILVPHVHKERPRSPSFMTQECVIVLEGKVEYKLLDEEDWSVYHSGFIEPGGYILLLGGAHTFRIMGPTKLLEVKTGPYVSDEVDKEKNPFLKVWD